MSHRCEDRVGASAPGDAVLACCGVIVDAVCGRTPALQQ